MAALAAASGSIDRTAASAGLGQTNHKQCTRGAMMTSPGKHVNPCISQCMLPLSPSTAHVLPGRTHRLTLAQQLVGILVVAAALVEAALRARPA